MAGAYLEILQGDDYSYSTNVAVDGVIQNIAGAAVQFLAKESPEWEADGQAVVNASTAGGEITISNNVITMTLNAATTANIPQANLCFWAMKLTTALGFNYTVDRGRLTVLAPIITP